MAGRTVLARLSINGVDGVVAGFKRAGSAVQEYARVSQKSGTAASRWVSKHKGDIDEMSGGLLKFGAVGALALGGLTKTAMDWESAWAGVTKTVNGSESELDTLQEQLRGMARELPASHEEIAAVAEAAGQLGVQVGAVDEFTRTMIDLGETTNLSATEAASSLAQFMNIMGTSQSEVGRLGSAIVALGNNSATTEADIVAMSQRIAGAGRQMGMSEADVVAIAAALASVGVEAEAGGTAVSTVMKRIDKAVREGGESLDGFARIAGVSSEEFATAWRTDAASALATVTEGLGGMQARGEDANKALSDLGITGIRESDALLRLSSATREAGGNVDLLRDSLKLGAEAWAENTALAEEAEKRYQTTASQAKIAMNIMRDEAIDLGNQLLPVFSGILTMVNDLVTGLGGMPDPAKNAGLAILGIATMSALAAGGVGKLLVAANNTKVALKELGVAGRTAGLALGAVGAVLAVAGIVLGNYTARQAEAAEKVRGYTAAIKEQGDVIGASTRELAAKALQDAGVLDMAEKYGASLSDVTDAALGSSEAMARVREAVQGSTSAITEQIAANQAEIDSIRERGLASDNDRLAIAKLTTENERLTAQMQLRYVNGQDMVDAIDAERSSVEKATDAARQMEEASADGADATKDSAEASLADAEAKAMSAEAMAEAAEAQRELLDATQAYGDALLQLSGSQIGVESAIAGLTDSLEENGATLDITTEKGRDNQKALDDLAASSMRYVETLYEQGASSSEIAAATQRARDEWIKGAVAMGMSEDQAKDLADAYFAIPDDVTTTVALPGAKNSKAEAEGLNRRLEGLPDSVRSKIVSIFDKSGAQAAENALSALQRERTVRIRAVYVGVRNSPTMGRTVAQATGGVVDYYGLGGVRDVANRHIAEIAPAGAWRVFAEPETEGEAYIPFRKDTRARSIDIWKEAGRRLGVYRYAEGAVVNGSAVLPTADTRPQVVIHSETYYPVAEPASVREKALLDHAAALGLGG